jgi:hypothetical protein
MAAVGRLAGGAGGGGAVRRGGAGLRRLAGARNRPPLRPDATRPRVLLASWRRIATPPGVRGLGAADLGFTYGGLFTMLAGSSFVYIDVLGLTPAAYGRIMLGSQSLAYIGGTFICRRWVLAPRPGGRGAARRAVHAGRRRCCMALPAAAGVQSVWAVAAADGCSRSATACTSPAARAAPSARSPTRPAPRRRWPASCWPRWPSASACGWAALDGTVRRWPMAWRSGRCCQPATVAWTLVRRIGGEPWPMSRLQGLACLAGPTAAGKTAVALDLAQHLGRWRSSASTRPWSTAAWTSAPPSPRRPSAPRCRTT